MSSNSNSKGYSGGDRDNFNSRGGSSSAWISGRSGGKANDSRTSGWGGAAYSSGDKERSKEQDKDQR